MSHVSDVREAILARLSNVCSLYVFQCNNAHASLAFTGELEVFILVSNSNSGRGHGEPSTELKIQRRVGSRVHHTLLAIHKRKDHLIGEGESERKHEKEKEKKEKDLWMKTCKDTEESSVDALHG